jgi:hypothetical protein
MRRERLNTHINVNRFAITGQAHVIPQILYPVSGHDLSFGTHYRPFKPRSSVGRKSKQATNQADLFDLLAIH